jgi:biopolymer transport protein ExbD
MLHKRFNSLKPIYKIDLTAFSCVMAAVVLALLTVEMVASPLGWADHGVGIDLPRVNHPVKMWAANQEDAMVVSIMRDGNIFFCNDRVAVEQLPDKIRERLSHNSERKVYIKADAHARYGTVSTVLEGIRSTGVLKIAFLVEQRRISIVAQ